MENQIEQNVILENNPKKLLEIQKHVNDLKIQIQLVYDEYVKLNIGNLHIELNFPDLLYRTGQVVAEQYAKHENITQKITATLGYYPKGLAELVELPFNYGDLSIAIKNYLLYIERYATSPFYRHSYLLTFFESINNVVSVKEGAFDMHMLLYGHILFATTEEEIDFFTFLQNLAIQINLLNVNYGIKFSTINVPGLVWDENNFRPDGYFIKKMNE